MLGETVRGLLHMETLPPDRIEELSLERGSHESREQGLCSLEALAWLAGEPHSDTPLCVCPAIAEFVTNWNDLLGDGDRDRMLRPVLPHLARTNMGRETELERHARTLDWLTRRNIPAWLEMAGFDKLAARLARFSPINSRSKPGQLAKAAEMLERAGNDLEKARKQIPGTRALIQMAGEAVIISGNPAVDRWGPDRPGRLEGSWILEAADPVALEAAMIIAGMAGVEYASQNPEERLSAGAAALDEARRRTGRDAPEDGPGTGPGGQGRIPGHPGGHADLRAADTRRKICRQHGKACGRPWESSWRSRRW